MTPDEREARLHWRLDPLLAHLATNPTPTPDDRDLIDGESDVRPWVDEPDNDYAYDPPQMRDPQ